MLLLLVLARGVVWFWIVLELRQRGRTALTRIGYFPGAATAPLLLLLALWVAATEHRYFETPKSSM